MKHTWYWRKYVRDNVDNNMYGDYDYPRRAPVRAPGDLPDVPKLVGATGLRCMCFCHDILIVVAAQRTQRTERDRLRAYSAESEQAMPYFPSEPHRLEREP